MNLLLRTRLHLLRLSHPLFLTIPFASSNSNCISLHRLFLSTVSTEAPPPPPQPHFSAVDYLIQSCGLSSQEALRASKKIDHLKFPDKPQAVLQFLRDTGVGESDIRKAVLREPGILRSSVEKNWRPNVVKLQELGFSIEDISALISTHPNLFTFNIVSRIEFWMRVLGSTENLSLVLKVKGHASLLCPSLENVVTPNLSFLQKQLGLDLSQIVRIIDQSPFLFTSSPESLMIKVKEVEDLGVNRCSRTFVYALMLVSNVNRRIIDARLNNLRNLGFSKEEVTILVSKHPFVLKVTEELMARKVEFLMKEVGCDNSHVICQPSLLTYSLDKRLIPRNLVKKLLESKGIRVTKREFFTFANPTEKQFLKKFIHPYEHAILGLHQAYADACSGKTSAKEWFKTASI